MTTNLKNMDDDRQHQSRDADTRPSVLWWSRSGRDYSRNRIVRQAFQELGWRVEDFTPKISWLGDWQARLSRVASPTLVWVPCFRHRDSGAAIRFARSRGVPVVFDPLISAYDKEVFEKERCVEGSKRAESLRIWEGRRMQQFDAVVADTQCHADFYESCFELSRDRLHVIPVGAERGIFAPQPVRATSGPMRVMFYGSFIGLQGPEIIAEAARQVSEVHWTLLGDGPLRSHVASQCAGLSNVLLIGWVPYEELPNHIATADVLLGVFGASSKAGRVIPNKVYQSLACGRPVVTQRSDAYPKQLRQQSAVESGMQFIAPGSASELADAVRHLAAQRAQLAELSAAASRTFDVWFSEATVVVSLKRLLNSLIGSSQLIAES